MTILNTLETMIFASIFRLFWANSQSKNPHNSATIHVVFSIELI